MVVNYNFMAGIVNKLSSVSNLISNSVNAAGASMVGQNVGAQKYERVPRIMLTCFSFALCSSTLLSVAVLLFLMILNPTYLTDFINHPIGKLLLIASVFLEAVGFFLINHIVDIKY